MVYNTGVTGSRIGRVEGVLFVVFAMEEYENTQATRIISARPADEEEAEEYFDSAYGV